MLRFPDFEGGMANFGDWDKEAFDRFKHLFGGGGGGVNMGPMNPIHAFWEFILKLLSSLKILPFR